MMVRYSPLVVHDDCFDEYSLRALVPLHIENDLEWADYCADIFVWIIGEPSHKRDFEALGIDDGE